MKILTVFLAAALCPLLPAASLAQAPAAVNPASAPSTNSGARIEFAEPTNEFGIVAAGDIVKHIFVFTNTGNQTLQVTNVHPGCGCTTAADWTKVVEPGQTGNIPIAFNSTEFTGPVDKTVDVRSTDPTHALVTLHIKGTVWRALEVMPEFVVLNYMLESSTNPWTIVSITNNLETPLILDPPQCTLRAMEVELKTNEPGHSYSLYVAAKPPIQRGLTGEITIKTSSTNTPVIRLTAMINFQTIVGFSPRQIVLPAPPLARSVTNSVRIYNHGTNQVVVSDAKVNYEGVDVQIKELVPGQSYLATMIFPQGFGLAPGRPMNLTVKTSHPQYPELKVGVLQMARTSGSPPPRASKPPNSSP